MSAFRCAGTTSTRKTCRAPLCGSKMSRSLPATCQTWWLQSRIAPNETRRDDPGGSENPPLEPPSECGAPGQRTHTELRIITAAGLFIFPGSSASPRPDDEREVQFQCPRFGLWVQKSLNPTVPSRARGSHATVEVSGAVKSERERERDASFIH
jgi:hypothetical protein